MKKKWTMTVSVVAMMILLLGLASSGLAQGNGPQTPLEPGDIVGSAFTYQGRLTDNGSPANGSYDFEFKLYDSAGGVSQVGSAVTLDDVTVSDGLFTVELDFGFGGVFTGDARWLEIGVRAGSSSGAYTTLAPRQALTAAPYALSLRPGAQVIGENGSATLTARNTRSAFGYGLVGGTDAETGAGVVGYTESNSGEVHGVIGDSDSPDGYGVYGMAPRYGVYGEARRTSGDAYGVFGEASSLLGYAGYFSNKAGGVDIMAAGSGVIKSKADSVLYLSPHDMVVRGSSGVSITPLDNGGADIYYTTAGWKYISLPVPTFGTLFGSPLYIESVQVCYKTDSTGYIGATSVIKNNGSTGAVSYIYDTAHRTSSSHSCYAVIAPNPAVIDNSTWVQFNIWSNGTGHTYIYTVELTLTETP